MKIVRNIAHSFAEQFGAPVFGQLEAGACAHGQAGARGGGIFWAAAIAAFFAQKREIKALRAGCWPIDAQRAGQDFVKVEAGKGREGRGFEAEFIDCVACLGLVFRFVCGAGGIEQQAAGSEQGGCLFERCRARGVFIFLPRQILGARGFLSAVPQPEQGASSRIYGQEFSTSGIFWPS